MEPNQFLELIIRPTIKQIALYSEAAEQLILGTIWQESQGIYLKQLGGGQALGLIQMEQATHDDIWKNYLRYQLGLIQQIKQLLSINAVDEISNDIPPAKELIGNLPYAVAMCRVHYLRVREPLPSVNNIDAMASYWKRYYNTRLGKGTVEKFIESYPL